MESARAKAFVTSAEEGSFTAAAKVLGYTPSGVSQLVSAYENELGFQLLIRSKKGVTLTDNGRIIMRASREFLNKEDQIYEYASAINGMDVGTINIASFSSIATHLLPSIISDFMQKYPEIRIHLIEGLKQDIYEHLEEGTADIGFATYMPKCDFDWYPFMKDPMVAILPKNSRYAGSDYYPLKEAEKESFIMPGLGKDMDVAHFLNQNNVEVNVKFTTIENQTCIKMVEYGLGMSIMNEMTTWCFDADVVKIPVEPKAYMEHGIVIPDINSASPAVKKFAEFARAKLSGETPEEIAEAEE